MEDSYISHILNFIKQSDLSMRLPQVDKIEIKPNNQIGITMELGLVRFNVNQINSNFPLSITILFSLLDSLIDLNYPHLGGESFKKRYEGLNKESSRGKVFKETYRITKLIRNAVTHNRTAISVEEEYYNVVYTFRNTEFRLKIHYLGIQFLNTLIFLIGRTNAEPSHYENSLVIAYYDLVISQIVEFNDEFTAQPLVVNQNANPQLLTVYRIKNPKVSKKENDEYHIEALPPASMEDNRTYEYIIKDDNRTFLLPHDQITSSTISLSELEKWEVNNKTYTGETGGYSSNI